MNVSAQLAGNSGLRVRVNRKVPTTDNNKQGDVQTMEYGIAEYVNLVWNISLVCETFFLSLR